MASKKSKVNDRAEADMSGEIEDALNEAQLEELYAWVDTIPLSRPKKNIARDFSDGGNQENNNFLVNVSDCHLDLLPDTDK